IDVFAVDPFQCSELSRICIDRQTDLVRTDWQGQLNPIWPIKAGEFDQKLVIPIGPNRDRYAGISHVGTQQTTALTNPTALDLVKRRFCELKEVNTRLLGIL